MRVACLSAWLDYPSPSQKNKDPFLGELDPTQGANMAPIPAKTCWEEWVILLPKQGPHFLETLPLPLPTVNVLRILPRAGKNDKPKQQQGSWLRATRCHPPLQLTAQ